MSAIITIETTAVPEAEQCGWLKDKYGLSWQIVPTAMDEIFKNKDPEKNSPCHRGFSEDEKVQHCRIKKSSRRKLAIHTPETFTNSRPGSFGEVVKTFPK